MCNECECDTDADLLHQYMGLVAKALDTPALIDERRIQSNFPLAFSKRQKIQQPIGDELPSVILPPPAFPKQPRSRLAKAKVTTDPKARANREKEERQRQAMITGGYLAEANMPSARQALLSLQPERALAALAGSARANTLRKHNRAWNKLRGWLSLTFNVFSPTSAHQVVDFLWHSFDEPCSASFPSSILQAISYMERLGGVTEHALHTQAVLRKTVDHLTAQLATGFTETRHAEPILIGMVVALEIVVLDEGQPVYVRAYAWYRLVKIWAGLRADDMRGTPPDRVALLESGLELGIERTKTSGVGKKVQTLRGFVSVHYWIWLDSSRGNPKQCC